MNDTKNLIVLAERLYTKLKTMLPVLSLTELRKLEAEIQAEIKNRLRDKN